uniref:obscurin-like n=1 Tax=Styela clava TaxID=7725 RepID=UPI00193A7644|nr:obscurin-like [Styela clava]
MDPASSTEVKGVAPEFVEKPRGRSAKLGGTIKFSSRITGSPKPQVIWLKQGKPMKEDGRITIYQDQEKDEYVLTVSRVREGDYGEYVCFADNENGETKCRVCLSKYDRRGSSSESEDACDDMEVDPNATLPVFVRKPKDQAKITGDTAVFTAKVFGNPEPTVHWTKGKWMKINGYGRFKMSHNKEAHTYTLKVTNLDVPDTGLYRCVASNKHGEVDSSFQVTVTEHVVKEKFEPEQLRKVSANDKPGVKFEDIAEIMELLREVDPKEYEKYARYYNLKDLKPTLSRYQESQEIEDEELLAAVCQDASDAGDLLSFMQRNLSVTEPVKEIRGLESINALQGTDIEFLAELKMFVPEIEVNWYKGNRKVTPSERFEIIQDGDIYRLKISNVDLSDASRYRIVAGPYSSTARLRVADDLDKLQELNYEKVAQLDIENTEAFSACLETYTCTEMETVIFECEVKDVNARVTWYKDGEPIDLKNATDKYKLIEDGRKRSLIVKRTNSEDSSEYTCISGQSSTTGLLIVQDGIQDKSVNVGGAASFEVVTQRDSTTLIWYLDGKKLENGENVQISQQGNVHTLKLHNLRVSQAGVIKYEVIDSSVADLIRSESDDKSCKDKVIGTGEAKLTVAKDTKVPKSSKFDYEVEREDIQVKWLKNDTVEIRESEKYRLESYGCKRSLIVNYISPDDQSTYKCEPIDSAAKVESSLQEVRTCEGGEATFHCVLSHNDVNITWYKQGAKLKNSNVIKISKNGREHTLTLTDVTLEDAGAISIETDCGLKDSTSLIVDSSEIEILEKLEDGIFDEGSTVTLSCVLSVPNVHGSWYCNDQKLTRSESIKIRTEGTKQSLILHDITVDDAGTYYFAAIGMKTTANITVNESGIRFTKKLQDTSVTELDVAELSCELSKQSGKVTWYKNGAEMKSSEHAEIITEGKWRRLVITKATEQDAGLYSCKCEKVETRCNLSIDERGIKIRQELREIEVPEDGTASFECEVSHNEVNVNWFLNDTLLKVSENVLIKSIGRKHRLVLSHLTAQQSGRVEIKAGSASSIARLEVLEPPVEFVCGLKDVIVEETSDAKLECEVSRKSAQVRWYKGRTLIQASEKHTIVAEGCKRSLILHKCTFEDEKKYICDADDVRTYGKLTVAPREIKFIQSLKETKVIERDEARFEIVLSHKDVEVSWFKNGAKMSRTKNVDFGSDGDKHWMVIHSVDLDDDTATISAHAEEEKSSALLSVEEYTVEIVKPMGDTTVIEKNTAEFVVETNYDNIPHFWYKDDVKLKRGNFIEILEEGRRHTLKMHNCQLSDTSVIRFSSKTAESTSRLTVIEPPVHFSKPLKTKTCEEMDKVALECEVSRPNAIVTWYRENDKLSDGEKYKIESEGVLRRLVIFKTTMADNTDWTCDGVDSKTSTKLVVKEIGITFTKPLKAVSFQEGEDACLSCEINTSKEVDAEWIQYDKIINSLKNIK